MIYNWYFITDLQEFIDAGVISRKFDLIFPDGRKEILLTFGNLAAITVDDIFLPIYMNETNPFERDGYAVYYDSEGGVWLGIDAS